MRPIQNRPSLQPEWSCVDRAIDPPEPEIVYPVKPVRLAGKGEVMFAGTLVIVLTADRPVLTIG